MDWRVIEGDCLEIMPTLADASCDAIIADVPYGVTSCKWDAVIPFAPMWEQLRRIAKPRAAIVLFASQPFTSALVMSNPAWFKYTWVWNKNNSAGFLNAKKRPFIITEDICVFADGATTYNPQMEARKSRPVLIPSRSHSSCYGDYQPRAGVSTDVAYPKNIIAISKAQRLMQWHPSEKPVALMEYLIRTYTNTGDTVLDFTAGSFTTGVAAINTGRSFIGIEREAAYCEIGRQRIAAAAQQPALLAAGG